MTDEERVYRVDMLTRVEGEGRFTLRVRDDEVVDAHLSIFEAPRYFEALLRGRPFEEVPDIVARICGICPIAYQMSAVHALESAFAFRAPPAIESLRRLMYCGEWVESHALHVFMLHAPDFLGYPSAIEMAADHRDIVERALRIKKVGNRILEVLGGRAIHPVSMRVGGFWRVPTVQEMGALRAEITSAADEIEDTLEWMHGLDIPAFEQDYVFVALRSDDYPLESGDALMVSGHSPMTLSEFEERTRESQVAHSNALQCHLADGTPYLTGPLARLFHFADRLHPRAAAALERSGLRLPVRNPHLSIVVRAIEILHALAEAERIAEAYAPTPSPYQDVDAREGTGYGCSEAPRGICWHRYDIDAEGRIASARIVPPTSQNQARIEQDLRGLAPTLLALDHADATRLCERVIRTYDPCISCATHFLRLDIERLPSPSHAAS